ncbi:MAG: GGDEF domain-containing protein, partial [Patescibacteria group bacterium]|nr:GGDEF domain-containing protein [Patescibacteria group bacterium]
QADIELRAQADDPDGDSIRACLESLLEASREFAQQREQAQDGLGDLWGETSEFGVARNRLEGAFGQQDAQIESTERAVAAFPYVDDLTQGCRVMIGETTKLMDANVLIRDSLQEVGIELARGENRLTNLEPAKRRDALTGAESRAALEGVLLQWMDGDEERPSPLSVAAVDIDAFSRVNEDYGHAVGNQLLQAVGKLLAAENGNRARLARFSGERFVLLFPNSDLRATTNAVERLRQIVELACFDYKKAEVRITVSCGVAEAGGEDTVETIMARAEATLMEAKRYGRNRTFIHEGKYPTPVVPPKFPIEPRRMSL